MIYLAYAVAWICTATATGLGLYYTHSPWCLLALIIPAEISLKHNSKDDNKNNKEQESEEEQ